MKKSIIVVILLVLFLGLAIGSYFIFFQKNTRLLAGSQTQSAASSLSASAEKLLSLDLEFDKVQDQQLLGLLPVVESDPDLAPSENFIEDGSLVFSSEDGLRGVNVNMPFQPDGFFHVRLKVNSDNLCFNTGIFSSIQNGEKRINLESCPFDSFQIQAIKNLQGDHQKSILTGTGLILLNPGQWFDFILWMNSSGDQVYYFASAPDDPDQFLYGGVALPEDWRQDSWRISLGGYFGGEENSSNKSMNVDFLRYGNGQITDYLDSQIPAYLLNQSEVDTFLRGSTLTLLGFEGDQGNLQNEVQEVTEVANAQTEKPMESEPEKSTESEPEIFPESEPVKVVETEPVILTRAQLFKQFVDTHPVIGGKYQIFDLNSSEGTLFNQHGFSMPVVKVEAQSNRQFGEVNFFYFEDPNLTWEERLDDFEQSKYESLIPDSPVIGDTSRMVHAGGEPPYFRGIFVKNNWVVIYFFDERTKTDPPSALMENPLQVQAFFDELLAAMPPELLDPSLLQPRPEFAKAMAKFQNTPDFLPEEFLINATSAEDTWSTAEKAGCLLLSENNNDMGKVCLFRDYRPDLDDVQRLSLMDDLTAFNSSGIDQTGLQLGDSSKLKTARKNGDQLVYIGQFVSGEWSGYFEIPKVADQDMLAFIPALFQPILDQLPQVAASQDQSVALDENDQLFFGMADRLAQGYYLGKLTRYNKDGVLVHEIDLMGQTDQLKKGSIKLWHYSGWLLDQSRTDFELPNLIPPAKPIITGVKTIADRSVLFKWDEDPSGPLTILRFQKSDVFADVVLLSDIPDAQSTVQQTAQILADEMDDPPFESMPLVGNENEVQYLQCFPAQGDLGFDKPMAQYTINSSLTHKGFIYSTRYTDFTLVDHYAPVGTLGVSIKVFNVPMAGLDIPDYENDEKEVISGLGDYAQLSQVINTNNTPHTYESTLVLVKGQSLVTLTMVELESNPKTRERLINVAQSMEGCLPQEADASRVISVPSDINNTPLQEGIMDLEGYGQGDEQNSSKLELFGILHLYITEPLDAPLTIALLDQRTQLIYFKKQEKAIPPMGEYNVILRPEDQLVIPSSGSQLFIWSGDRLLLHTFPMVEQGGGF